ncbi:Ribokinase-like protein [Scheffersomyces xylosifermentans]|uniref:Ribokinase-like protein n=1 Tax=Scheffersomyces xylosifermentans TaxID=1304137 RepID=UPI00315CE2F0
MLRNKSQKELLQLSKQIIQPLLPSFHKGQAGKITVIGGCEDYTGAPFFACHSSALIGADMAHVICEKVAAPIIKSYSPDLMIHPYLYELHNPDVKLSPEDLDKYSKIPLDNLIHDKHPTLTTYIDERILPKVLKLLERTDIVVVGPGLGRDPLMLKSLVRIIEEIKVLNKSIVLDADALFLISLDPSLIQNYPKAILTPNVIEFQRLASKFGINTEIGESDFNKIVEETQTLSKKLGNVTIIRKGKQELIVKNEEYLVNEIGGSSKRVGGQGDTLTGAIATLVNWSNNYSDKLWDPEVKESDRLTREEANLLACFTASALVRLASRKAFKKYGRSMQTSNIHEFLSESYNDLFESENYLKL